MNMTLHLTLCGVLALATVCMYIYRRWLENHDDHYIHLHDDQHDAGIITTQTTMAKRLDAADKVKYALLVATILYGVAIAAMAIYTAWNTSGI
jgi:hypothetical protein